MKRTLAVAALALLANGCITLNVAPFGGGPLEEQVVFGDGDAKVLLLDVQGTLSEQGERGTLGLQERESIVARVREELERAAEDDDVRAVVLRIHSPGGTVTASEILYDEVRRFKQDTGLPVVAQLMGVAASGGYYVAMAADTVRAYPTSITGSIGVIFASVNLAGLMEKIGVEDQTLTTGPFKDAGSPLRPMREAEREQLQGVLEELFARFVEVVDAGRPDLDRERVRELADGRIFSAGQALEAGLVDELGDLEEAVEEAKQRAGVEQARVVVYRRPGEGTENLFSTAAPAPQTGGTAGVLAELARPAFLYLWWPSAP